MRITVLSMLSTNTLAAFSSANATASLKEAGPARLVREPVRTTDTGSTKPFTVPALPQGRQPRGSLLNLSV